MLSSSYFKRRRIWGDHYHEKKSGMSKVRRNELIDRRYLVGSSVANLRSLWKLERSLCVGERLRVLDTSGEKNRLWQTHPTLLCLEAQQIHILLLRHPVINEREEEKVKLLCVDFPVFGSPGLKALVGVSFIV
jgi:hypothetical protein